LIKGVSIMPAYNATFGTYTHYADLAIEADTPEQALWISTRACGFTTGRHEVFFHSYECAGAKTLMKSRCVTPTARRFNSGWMTTWRCAASAELRDALEALVEHDRAEAAASGFSDDEMTSLEDARRALALAKGGVSTMRRWARKRCGERDFDHYLESG
jgi:hypothetical protein